MNRLPFSSCGPRHGCQPAYPPKSSPPCNYEKFASGFVSPLSMIPYGEGEQAYLVVDQAGVISLPRQKKAVNPAERSSISAKTSSS